MTQVSKRPINKSTHERIFDLFIKTLLHVHSKNDASQLIVDFFTPTEQIMFAKRISIIFLLEKGYNYQSIRDTLKVSTSTISQVNKSRKKSSREYRKIIAQLVSDERKNTVITQSLAALVTLPAHGGEGSGIWKAVKKDLQKKEKPF